MPCFLCSFSCLVSFCSIVSMLCPQLQITKIHGFILLKEDILNSVAQDSIMNAHKNTQLTHARIKCALKVSKCDSPLSKNLKLTILASNASSSSTKEIKCPHTKNDSMFTHNGSTI
ncbi:hypothetical protein H5410_002082 [Solanum commersonii]|uniref:Secreted protein n=1 Tax=Solanum commersonii TaxID=4109 RepID=A0A9J6B0N0_SOLCO|nr:hypothetical protein H5410_002082 [Solanum commersonii]